MLPLNLSHLYYFFIIAKNRSITGAARELFVSQSSLSIQMKQFETSLGQKLFHRSKTGVELTDFGVMVYHSAERIFEEVDKLRASLEQAELKIRGSFAIGTVNSVGIYLLPDLLKAFKEHYPEVGISIDFKSARDVIEMVQAGKIDIAIITWNRRYPDLISIPLQTNKMFLVCHPDHDLAGQDDLSPRDLEKHQFIAYEEGSPTRILMDGLFKRMAMDVEYMMETSNTATIKHMVIAGLGLAFLPETVVGQEIRDNRLARLEVPTLAMAQEITIYFKKGRMVSPTKKEFIDFLQKGADRRIRHPVH